MVLVKIGGALLGAFVGLQLSYWAGASIACGWLWPHSNMCGLPAVFLASRTSQQGEVGRASCRERVSLTV